MIPMFAMAAEPAWHRTHVPASVGHRATSASTDKLAKEKRRCDVQSLNRINKNKSRQNNEIDCIIQQQQNDMKNVYYFHKY